MMILKYKIFRRTFATFLGTWVLTFLVNTSLNADVQWLDRIVAVAGKQAITQTELDKEFNLIERDIRIKGGTPPSRPEMSRQVLERLIMKKLQLQAAERMGIRIDDTTLEQGVNQIAKENGMTIDQFRHALNKENIVYADFRENIRNELTVSRLRERQLNQRINVTDQEIEDLISANQKSTDNKDYRLMHILISVPGAASPQEIETAKGKAQEIRNLALEGADFGQLAISHSDGQKALEGGDLGWRSKDTLPTIFSSVVTELEKEGISQPIRSPSGFHLVKIMDVRGGKARAQANQVKARHILITAVDGKTKLKKIHQQILNGADFADLAKQHSDDKGSGAQGGELGWAFPAGYVPAFAKMISTLNVGEVSVPFRSRFGWHIVEVQDRRTAEVPDELLKNRAREVIMTQRREEELQLWLRRLRDEAFVEYRLPELKPSS